MWRMGRDGLLETFRPVEALTPSLRIERMRFMKTSSLLMFFLLSSCSLHQQLVEEKKQPILEEGSPTPQSAVSGGPTKIRIPQKAKIKKAITEPSFRFNWKGRSFEIGAGVWENPEYDSDWNRMYGWGPVFWVNEKNSSRVLDLRKELVSHFVSHVFQDEQSGRIFVFLDYGIEGPASEYKVWISEDAGEHWFEGGILLRPPEKFPPANLDSFFLDSEGKGVVWFRAETSHGADAIYRATTRDGGHSWISEEKPLFFSVLKRVEKERR